MMSDLISREAAIDELDKGAWGVEWDKTLAKTMIESLPSAQPTQNTRVNSNNALDTISRQAAIDAVRTYYDDEYALADSIEELIEKLPSAQPEIVQCKDCKHRIEHKYYGNLGESAYTCEGNMGGWILPDDFCSLAERRTDDSISD